MALLNGNGLGQLFREFDEASHFKRLGEKVKDKPYYKKFKGFKDTVLGLSYVLNIASALTASFAAYWVANWITNYHIISVAVAVVFLLFLEQVKRRSSGEFWQVWFFQKRIASGWIMLSLVCFGISLASSSFGTHEGVEELGPGPEVLAMDSTAREYRSRIAALEADNERLSKQRNHQGEIYWPAQKEKQKNTEMIAELQLNIIALDKKLEKDNGKLTAEYQADQKMTQEILIIVMIIFEILFELCILYIWYFHYRTYIETKLSKGIAEDTPKEFTFDYKGSSPHLSVNSTPNVPAITPQLLQQLLVALQQLDINKENVQNQPTPDPTQNDLQKLMENLSNSQNGLGNNSIGQDNPSSESNSNASQQIDNPLQQDAAEGFPIGYYTKGTQENYRRRHSLQHIESDRDVLQRVKRLVKQQEFLLQQLPGEEQVKDRHTVLHFNFNNGKPIRYAIGRVNGIINDYSKRLLKEPNLNNEAKLLYWKLRQAELIERKGREAIATL